MSELFISKDGINYQKAKGNVEIDFVTIPKQILESTAVKLKLIQSIAICTSDVETVKLLSDSTKIFIKYTEETTNTTGKKGKVTFYSNGFISIEKGNENDSYRCYCLIVIKEKTYAYFLKALAEKDLKKAQKVVADEYFMSKKEFQNNIV